MFSDLTVSKRIQESKFRVRDAVRETTPLDPRETYKVVLEYALLEVEGYLEYQWQLDHLVQYTDVYHHVYDTGRGNQLNTLVAG